MNDNWPIAKIGDCASLVRHTLGPDACNGEKYIGLEHIGEGSLTITSTGDGTLVQSAKSKFQAGDALFGKLRPYFRKVAIAPFDGVCSTDIWVIRAKTGTDQRFLFYRLASQEFIDAATRGSEGTKMPRAKWEFVSRFAFPLPPLPIQKRIAHILGTLDNKIELNRRMNETLEAMARSIFKSWFIDFDPVHAKAARRNTGLPNPIADLFPSEFQNSELGLIPKGWGVLRFSESVEVAGGGTPRTSVAEYWNGEIPWYSVVDAPRAGDVFVVDTEKMVTSAGIENSSANILPAGATIVSARGTVGKIALTGAPMAMNQSCYALRGKGGGATYHTYFATSCAIAAMQQMAHGSVFDTITRETLTRINVARAHAEVITQFEKLVAPMMMRILENVHQIRVLQNTRDTLLPQLLAGTMDICMKPCVACHQ